MGKQKGFLTYDEVNNALPAGMVSFDQLDDIMVTLSSLDIDVVDNAKAARMPSEVERPTPAIVEPDDDDGPAEPIDLTPGPVGRTEDPVRLYLREMGRVSLLTREGEIALAKRIEEGKNQVTRAILSTNLALERFANSESCCASRTSPSRRSSTSTTRNSPRRRRRRSPGRSSAPSRTSIASCVIATSSSSRPRSSAPRPGAGRRRPRGKSRRGRSSTPMPRRCPEKSSTS